VKPGRLQPVAWVESRDPRLLFHHHLGARGANGLPRIAHE